MNGNNFTNKAQDALMQAQQLAQEKGQQQIDALHLLHALLSQEGSIVLTVLQKLGIDVEILKKKAESQISKIPTMVSPQAFGQFYLTQDMAKVLDRARQEAMKMKDEFISVEHLFFAVSSGNITLPLASTAIFPSASLEAYFSIICILDFCKILK